MGESGTWGAVDLVRAPGPQRPATRALTTALVMAATAVMLTIGAVLAVIFAATLALVMALATALLGLSALVWRMRRRARPVRLEARRVGQSWIAYSWDRL